MDRGPDERRVRVWPIALSCSLLVILAWGLSWPILGTLVPSWNARAEVGDSFGVVNALFSGLAFVGLIVAILLQGQELSLQREELKLTRQELEKSSTAQGEMANAQREQAQHIAESTKVSAAVGYLAWIGNASNEALEKYEELRRIDVSALDDADKSEHKDALRRFIQIIDKLHTEELSVRNRLKKLLDLPVQEAGWLDASGDPPSPG